MGGVLTVLGGLGFWGLVCWSATSARGAAAMLVGLMTVAGLLLVGVGVLLVTGVR